MNRSLSDDVKKVLEERGTARLQAARVLTRGALERVGHIRARGSVRAAAQPTGALTAQDVQTLLPELERAFEDGELELAHELIGSLRYAAGREASAPLLRLLEERLREGEAGTDSAMFLLDALAAIGGETALEGITRAIEHGSPEVRQSAAAALRALVTGGHGDDTDEGSPVALAAEGAGEGRAVRVRGGGAVRTRGALGPRKPSPAVAGLRAALDAMGEEDDKYLSSRARQLRDLL